MLPCAESLYLSAPSLRETCNAIPRVANSFHSEALIPPERKEDTYTPSGNMYHLASSPRMSRHTDRTRHQYITGCVPHITRRDT